MIDKYPAHHLRGDAKEVSPVLPGDACLIYKPDVCLVNKRGGLQRVVRSLATQIALSEAAQLTVDHRQQVIKRGLVTFVPIDK